MKNIKRTLLSIFMLLSTVSTQAKAQIIRVTDLNSKMMSELKEGKLSGIIIEFRRGDELPLTFEALGDLLETNEQAESQIKIKRNFWIMLNQNNIKISLDGRTYKKLGELLKGSLDINPGSAQNGGVADSIAVIFKAFLKL